MKTVHEAPMMQSKARNLTYYTGGAQVNNDGSLHILGLPPNLISYNIDGSAIGTTTAANTLQHQCIFLSGCLPAAIPASESRGPAYSGSSSNL